MHDNDGRPDYVVVCTHVTCIHTLQNMLHTRTYMHTDSYTESSPPAGEVRDQVHYMVEHTSSCGLMGTALPLTGGVRVRVSLRLYPAIGQHIG